MKCFCTCEVLKWKTHPEIRFRCKPKLVSRMIFGFIHLHRFHSSSRSYRVFLGCFSFDSTSFLEILTSFLVEWVSTDFAFRFAVPFIKVVSFFENFEGCSTNPVNSCGVLNLNRHQSVAVHSSEKRKLNKHHANSTDTNVSIFHFLSLISAYKVVMT